MSFSQGTVSLFTGLSKLSFQKNECRRKLWRPLFCWKFFCRSEWEKKNTCRVAIWVLFSLLTNENFNFNFYLWNWIINWLLAHLIRTKQHLKNFQSPRVVKEIKKSVFPNYNANGKGDLSISFRVQIWRSFYIFLFSKGWKRRN